MHTIQGITYRRHLIVKSLGILVGYTALFALLVVLARIYLWPSISEWIADLTSVWMDVPEDQAVVYRMLGLQEGMMVDGMYRFRDLSDYYHVVNIITGPALWGCYVLGLTATSIWCVCRAAHGVDDLTAALEQIAAGKDPILPDEFKHARQVFERLAERDRAREQAAIYAETRKNELVAYLAHDIKTPLTSIIGYLALLAEEPTLPIERREHYAQVGLEKAQRLDVMMDEFFEITRYNLGAISLERETIDIKILLEQVADELYPAASTRHVTLEVHVPAQLTAFIDPEKMARVLGNLLKNAVAYAMPSSCVSLCASSHDEDLKLVVKDTGKEISQAHLARIFDKFYREDGARSGKGTGLGLAIAKEIVEARGGTINAESTCGVTTFTVILPSCCNRVVMLDAVK